MEQIKRYGECEMIDGKSVNSIIEQLEAVNEINRQLNEALKFSQNPKAEINENIYSMKLNDVIDSPDLIITRVPGGWLYSIIETYDQQKIVLNPVFVPMNKEFDTDKNTEVVEFPEVENSGKEFYENMILPNDCQINCQYLEEDCGVDGDKTPLHTCTIKDYSECPMVIQQIKSSDE